MKKSERAVLLELLHLIGIAAGEDRKRRFCLMHCRKLGVEESGIGKAEDADGPWPAAEARGRRGKQLAGPRAVHDRERDRGQAAGGCDGARKIGLVADPRHRTLDDRMPGAERDGERGLVPQRLRGCARFAPQRVRRVHDLADETPDRAVAQCETAGVDDALSHRPGARAGLVPAHAGGNLRAPPVRRICAGFRLPLEPLGGLDEAGGSRHLRQHENAHALPEWRADAHGFGPIEAGQDRPHGYRDRRLLEKQHLVGQHDAVDSGQRTGNRRARADRARQQHAPFGIARFEPCDFLSENKRGCIAARSARLRPDEHKPGAGWKRVCKIPGAANAAGFDEQRVQRRKPLRNLRDEIVGDHIQGLGNDRRHAETRAGGIRREAVCQISGPAIEANAEPVPAGRQQAQGVGERGTRPSRRHRAGQVENSNSASPGRCDQSASRAERSRRPNAAIHPLRHNDPRQDKYSKGDEQRAPGWWRSNPNGRRRAKACAPRKVGSPIRSSKLN